MPSAQAQSQSTAKNAPHEPVPGLYCLERQRPVAHSPLPDSPRIIEREVVFLRPSIRKTTDPDAWEYIQLETKVINGIRRHRSPEGPYYLWPLDTLILGPIVGIYAPDRLTSQT